MGHSANPDELLEVSGDELRAVIRDDTRPLAEKLFATRWTTVSTSGSCMFGRISQWTMNRL